MLNTEVDLFMDLHLDLDQGDNNHGTSAQWGKLGGHVNIVHLSLCPIIVLMSNNAPVLVFINDL